MNLEQWQRSKKIKAEAEAAAKRTVERVLNAVKEPAMNEFEENKGIEGILKDVVEHGNDLAMVSIEGVEQVSIAHVINPFPCEELGDDSHIENHISPNCQSRDA
ncbi:hypothetical protein ABUP55_07635 [Acinetobacter baumannii]|uniref:hypothetical protein n=1 Tax=Acinetobacter baumannii TaxID=470 RepID=UPI000864BBF8|nr:hypothetical protein [Acinetobacter baumannii]AOP64009.1 hypothetical protein DU202_02850 [Acinetobacter baumannii DU202]